MTLAERLFGLRTDRGYTQQYVADKLSIHKSLYCNYEGGKRVPDMGKLEKLSQLYSVPLRSFILLPLRNTVIYSPGILDALEKAISDCKIGCHNGIKKQLDTLTAALDAVMAERNEALEFPDLGIDLADYTGQTIKVVTLDMRGERLIEAAMKMQHILFDRLLK